MPDVELSRRAAKAKVSRSFMHLDWDDQQAYVKAVTEANTFGDLPLKWKTFIINAENEPLKDPAIYGNEPATTSSTSAKK